MNWNKLSFIVMAIVLGALVYVGKVDAAVLLSLVTYLVPSPVVKAPEGAQ